MVLKAWPEVAKEKDGDQRTPLHVALRRNCSVEVIDLILKAWPEVAKEKDHEGITPLHVALEKKCSVEAIDLLLKAWPEAVMEGDYTSNMSPPHMALRRDYSVEVIDLVLKAWPEAVKEKEKGDDGMTPMLVVIENKCFMDVLETLVLCDLPIKHSEEPLDNSHVYSWTSLHDAAKKVDPETVMSLVTKVFAKYPTQARQLVFSKDESGREAISIANVRVRALMWKHILFLDRFDIGRPMHK